MLYSIPWPCPTFFQGQICSLAILTNAQKCKRYCWHQIGSRMFAIKWHQYEFCTSWPWPTFSRSGILKCESQENDESKWKMLKYDFDRNWYLSSNGTISNVVFCELDPKFQGHKFETFISRKRRALSQKCVIWLLLMLIFTIEQHRCECSFTFIVKVKHFLVMYLH